jgi:predicted transcriptional regulator
MPRFFNRKIEIRLDDDSLKQIDHIATTLGVSRAEFMRISVMANAEINASEEAPKSAIKPPLTVGEYHRMVSSAYKATGGAVSRVQVETCVAATLRELLGLPYLAALKTKRLDSFQELS